MKKAILPCSSLFRYHISVVVGAVRFFTAELGLAQVRDLDSTGENPILETALALLPCSRGESLKSLQGFLESPSR